KKTKKVLKKVLDTKQVGKRRKNDKYRKSQKRNLPQLHFRLCNTCHNNKNVFYRGGYPLPRIILRGDENDKLN
ncbi:TPA: hypothetical protein ACK0IG_000617, partial [Staphylococcus aureus]